MAITWAQRLKRVFNIDIETCKHCGGAVKATVPAHPAPTALVRLPSNTGKQREAGCLSECIAFATIVAPSQHGLQGKCLTASLGAEGDVVAGRACASCACGISASMHVIECPNKSCIGDPSKDPRSR